jgi:hypothetical protein
VPEHSPGEFDPANLDCVVADDLRFKQRLCIGEEAYLLLRAKNRLREFYDTIGMGATGAGIAKSSLVAGALFAPAAPTGVLSWLGLAAPAAAATPIGWVVAAAVVMGGGYYGINRWMAQGQGSFVDTIPKYINTPLDVLGARLMDLLGGLAVRVSQIDGRIDPAETELISTHFVEDWGFDAAYTQRALDFLASGADEFRVKSMAAELARFQSTNPDCNASAMQAQLMSFLRELVEVDGIVDEREELALEAIERVFSEEQSLTFTKAGQAIRRLSGDVGGSVSSAVSGVRSYAAEAVEKTRKLIPPA